MQVAKSIKFLNTNVGNHHKHEAEITGKIISTVWQLIALDVDIEGRQMRHRSQPPSNTKLQVYPFESQRRVFSIFDRNFDFKIRRDQQKNFL